MGVNVAASFKKDERSMNGLESIVGELLATPRESRYLIAEFEVVRVMEDIEDGGTRTPTIKLVHIEPMTDEADEKEAHRILQKAYLARQTSIAKDDAEAKRAAAEAAGQSDLFSDPED